MSITQSPNHHRSPWIARGIMICLVCLLVALVAFALLRPAQSSQDQRETTEMLSDMDAAQAAANEERDAAEAERVSSL